MGNDNNFRMIKRYIRAAVIGLIVLCFLFCAVLTFGNGADLPNWNTLYQAFRLDPASNLIGEDDFVRFLDVGQGDSILFYSNGVTALLDTGPADSQNQLKNTLKRCGVTHLDLLMFSHLEADHIGNACFIAENYPVGTLLLPHSLDSRKDSLELFSLRADVASSGGNIYTARQGMVVTVGNFEITVLACYSDPDEENNQSMILMAENGGKRILLTGDAETVVESQMKRENLDLGCDILKVAHHGSSTSTGTDFLAECHPEYAVISVGAANRYGHPNAEVLQRLERQKLQLYRTDLDGDVLFYFKDGKIKITS